MYKDYVPFTKEMKKDYTILVPNMLPMHFKLIIKVFENRGYKIDLLENSGPEVAATGLKYVHNDTCYPAILVIGQFISALESGKYDPKKTALLLSQTGGGCRASNYIALLRKALKKAGYGYIPVISFNLSGLEKHPGFKLNLPIFHRLFYAVIYGDMLLSLVNQCKPYELIKGESEELAKNYCSRLADSMDSDGLSFKKLMKNCEEMLSDFSAIKKTGEKKIKVGVVGEIYVKFSPLGNNNLEEFLVNEGAEVVQPGLLDFCLYCVVNGIEDYKLYGRNRLFHPFYTLAYNFINSKQEQIIEMTRKYGFRPPALMPKTVERIRRYIGIGTKMGEGWLLPAEMLELYDSGVKNIVCTQPFGCLPNHICGKGMMKPLKDNNPGMNIVAIDYDAGASRVNQENRLKLMLAAAKETETENKGKFAAMPSVNPEKEKVSV